MSFYDARELLKRVVNEVDDTQHKELIDRIKKYLGETTPKVPRVYPCKYCGGHAYTVDEDYNVYCKTCQRRMSYGD